MIKQLIKLSNHLDAKGLRKEADYLDTVIRKIAEPTKYGREFAMKLATVLQGLTGERFDEIIAEHIMTDEASKTSTYSLTKSTTSAGIDEWAEEIKNATQERLDQISEYGFTFNAGEPGSWPTVLRVSRNNDNGKWFHWRGTITGGDSNAVLTVVMTEEAERADQESQAADQNKGQRYD
jgi:hypothetical protein